MKLPNSAWIALLALVQGCGSDSGSPSNGAQGKKLSDLNLEERMQLCASTVDATRSIATGLCTLSGLDAPTKVECETAREQCNAATVPVTEESCRDPMLVEDFSECTTIRMSQVESCFQEASTFFSGLSCDAVGQNPMLPNCIQTLEEGCPVLIDGM